MEKSAIKLGGVRCLMANAIKNFHIFFEDFPNGEHTNALLVA